MKFYHFFETERLELHAVTKADASHQLAIMNTPKWLKNIGDRKVYTEEAAANYIAKKITPQFEKLGFGNYKVVRKSDGQFLGNCGLYDRPGIEGVDIGFAFLPAFEKKGYAFESAQKLKEEAFSNLGINTISAITIPANISSQKLLEKLGLRFVKMIRLPNDDEELMFYQIHNQKD